ncbi:OsmC family protein [Roseateles sp.]|uniref:OsmC family protein n=1 Tax=Roseateles sp. TaxID=1971397 RepID=UPI0025D8A052|nr:OsmC family protein [Roseateles sp.]MBV8034399.1 OsmC family protein [Roseateles sp.]
MSMQAVADALARLERVLRRRPETGLSADAPAQAQWSGPETPLRVVCRHPNGREVCTDLPPELGGGGGQVTPGWLYRAGLATCAATSIALLAAAEGVTLETLQVEAASQSDACGLIGLEDEGGRVVSPVPTDQRLVIAISARDATPAQLRSLVDRALQRSPIPLAVRANGLAVQVDAA